MSPPDSQLPPGTQATSHSQVTLELTSWENTLALEIDEAFWAWTLRPSGLISKFKVKPYFPYIQVLIFGKTFGISLKN